MSPEQTLLASSAALAVALVSNPALADDRRPGEAAPPTWFDPEEEPVEAAYPQSETSDDEATVDEAAADESLADDAAEDESDEVVVAAPSRPSAPAATAAQPSARAAVAYFPDRAQTPRKKKGEADTSRFRGGVGAIFGGVRYEDDVAFRFLSGVEARFGGQLDDTFGLYFAPSILVADSVRLASGVALDVTVADVFSLGAGLEALASSNADTGRWTPGTSINARSGFHIGKKEPGRRRVFSLETIAKIDLLFDDRKGLILGAALGYDAM